MRKWKQSGVAPSLVDDDVNNDALLPLCLAIPPPSPLTVNLSRHPNELIADIAALGDKFRLWRSIHRRMHLDQIEAGLRSK